MASTLGSAFTLILELKRSPYSKSKKKTFEKLLIQPRKMLLVPVPNVEVKAGICSFALGFGSLICGEVLIASGEIGIHAVVVVKNLY